MAFVNTDVDMDFGVMLVTRTVGLVVTDLFVTELLVHV